MKSRSNSRYLGEFIRQLVDEMDCYGGHLEIVLREQDPDMEMEYEIVKIERGRGDYGPALVVTIQNLYLPVPIKIPKRRRTGLLPNGKLLGNQLPAKVRK